MRTGACSLLLCARICPVEIMVPDGHIAILVSSFLMQSKWDCLTREMCICPVQPGRAVHRYTALLESAADLR